MIQRKLVGGIDAYGGKRPPPFMVGLKDDGGLLLWEGDLPPEDKSWVEVPRMPRAESELRRAFAAAMAKAPRGAVARTGRGSGLPLIFPSRNGTARVDAAIPGCQKRSIRVALDREVCSSILDLWKVPLTTADLPKPWPETFRGPNVREEVVAGREATVDFESESQMESYLIAHWDKLSFTWLDLVGRQYSTTRRERIDILCRNRDNSGFTVIELKLGIASEGALSQVLRYMTWVSEKLAEGDQSVWGLIFCRDAHPRLRDAVRQTPNVEIYTYEFRREFVVFAKIEGR